MERKEFRKILEQDEGLRNFLINREIKESTKKEYIYCIFDYFNFGFGSHFKTRIMSIRFIDLLFSVIIFAHFNFAK